MQNYGRHLLHLNANRFLMSLKHLSYVILGALYCFTLFTTVRCYGRDGDIVRAVFPGNTRLAPKFIATCSSCLLLLHSHRERGMTVDCTDKTGSSAARCSVEIRAGNPA